MCRWGLLVACIALGGCADLSPIDAGVCGNEVLEAGEDCDVHADQALGGELVCGAPGSPAECRYVCGAETSGCPLGWDCGSDETCRRPSGELFPAPPSPDWSPASLEPVDFNGDGRIDLVGAFADRIEFRVGDASGAFLDGLSERTLPKTGEIAVGHLDGDVRGDVLLPTSLGFGVWRGQPEGPPLQATYGLIPVGATGVRVLPVRYPDFAPEGVLVAVYPSGTGVRARIVADTKLYGEVAVREDVLFDDLRVAVGDLDHDENLRDEVAIGFRGDSVVTLYGVQPNDLTSDLLLLDLGSVDVSHPRDCVRCTETLSGFHLDKGVQIADVNGDGYPDLLASVTGPSPLADAVVVACGNGKGGLDGAYLDARFAALANEGSVLEGLPGELSPWPIAAGDLDDDGIADYVSANGIFLTSPGSGGALVQTYYRQTLQPWTAATLSDVDADGDVDVVSIAEGEPLVDVIRCLSPASGLFEHVPYTTKRPVTKVRSGRMQSLTASDIVLIESAGQDSPEDDALSVMYGRPFEFPEQPVRRASAHRIDQLEVGPVRYPGSQTINQFDDIHVSTRSGSSDWSASYGVLFAHGARQLSSPLWLTTNSSGFEIAFSAADRALPGRFSGYEHPYRDLILIGRSAVDLPQLWWVPGAEGAGYPPTPAGQSLQAALGVDFELDCARFAVGDIDGGRRDRVVAVFGRAFAVGGLDGAMCAAQASTRLAVGQVESGRLVFDEPRELAIDDAADGTVIALADLDGDDRADLVLARTGSVAVFRPGSSGLPSEPSFVVDLPPNERVLDIAPIARSLIGRGASRVAVLTDASVHAISADGTATKLASVRDRLLRSADVNGDGLGDLVLLGSGGVEVLFAIPASPLGGSP